MKSCSGFKERRQRGDALLEALVGILLLGVLGLGLSYATGRILVQQRNANIQDVVLAQMRYKLESEGLQQVCGKEAPIQVSAAGTPVTLIAAVECAKNPVTVVVSGNLPTPTEAITTVYTKVRYATSSTDAVTKQLMGAGSLVIQ